MRRPQPSKSVVIWQLSVVNWQLTIVAIWKRCLTLRRSCNLTSLSGHGSFAATALSLSSTSTGCHRFRTTCDVARSSQRECGVWIGWPWHIGHTPQNIIWIRRPIAEIASNVLEWVDNMLGSDCPSHSLFLRAPSLGHSSPILHTTDLTRVIRALFDPINTLMIFSFTPNLSHFMSVLNILTELKPSDAVSNWRRRRASVSNSDFGLTTPCPRQNGIMPKWYWTKRYGQNSTDKMV